MRLPRIGFIQASKVRRAQKFQPGRVALDALEDRKLLSTLVQPLAHRGHAEVHEHHAAHEKHAAAHEKHAAAHKKHKSDDTSSMPGMDMNLAQPTATATGGGVIPGTGGTFVSGLPFSQPVDLYSKNGVLNVTMTVKQEVVNVSGKNVYAMVYNDSFVGPTLHVNPGDTLKLNLVNKSNQPTNIHYHGLHVSPLGSSDNIFITVPAGGSYQYVVNIPKNEESGTNWYHSHMMGYSESQVFRGLSGIIMVDGIEKKMPANYTNAKQVIIGMKDLQVDATGAIPQTNIDSNAPTQRTVNGLVNPVLKIAPGETQIWHLANVGADIWYDFSLGGNSITVIAEDGGDVWKPYSVTDLVMPPGKRYDICVVGGPAGTTTQVSTLPFATGPAGDQYPAAPLLQLVSTGPAVKQWGALTTGLNSTSGDMSKTNCSIKRTFTFTQDNVTDQFYINGVQYNPNVNNVSPKLGATEEWTLVNGTTELHPFHLHVYKFQVISVNGVPYQANGTQDTVVLPAGGNVVIRIKFTDFKGRSVFHCHILHHEEQGMMQTVNVV